MWNILLTNLILPLAVETVKSYVKNTESKKDDKVLEVVQIGAEYLAEKDNNSVQKIDSNKLNKRVILKAQKAK